MTSVLMASLMDDEASGRPLPFRWDGVKFWNTAGRRKKKSRKSCSFYQWRIWCSWSVWALNQNRDVDTDLSFCGYFPTFLYKSELAHFMLIFWDSSRWCLISLSCLFDLFPHENLPTFPKQKKKLSSRLFCETGHCHHRRQHSLIKQR